MADRNTLTVLGIDIGTTTVKMAVIRFQREENCRPRLLEVVEEFHLTYDQHLIEENLDFEFDADINHGHHVLNVVNGNGNEANGNGHAHVNGNGNGNVNGNGNGNGDCRRRGSESGEGRSGWKPAGAQEVSMSLIVNTVQRAVCRLSVEARKGVEAIGICGQMHGCVLYSGQRRPWRYNAALQQYRLIETCGRLSPLYSWQDARCDESFLTSLPRAARSLAQQRSPSSGDAAATAFWLARNKPQQLATMDRMASAADLVAALICDCAVQTTEQMAYSFGYYEPTEGKWFEGLAAAGFPVHMLPTVRPLERSAGLTANDWCGMAAGVPVYCGYGDTQCAVYSVLHDEPHAAALNVGTSMQLAMPVTRHEMAHLAQLQAASCLLCTNTTEDDPLRQCSHTAIDYFPYFDGKYLAVAASLNGGNVISKFVHLLQSMLNDLVGSAPSVSQLWLTLQRLYDQQITSAADKATMQITPTIFGERHMPHASMSITNITADNCGIGLLFDALCTGLLDNIFSMLPLELLCKVNTLHTLVGIGNCLRQNRPLRDRLKKNLDHFHLDMKLADEADANVGVAMITAQYHFRHLQQSTH